MTHTPASVQLQTDAAARRAASSASFWALVGDSSAFNVAAAAFDPTTVLPLFIAQFTTSPLVIGMPAALRMAGLYLPQLPTTLAIRQHRRVKSFLLFQACAGRVPLLVAVPLALLASTLSPWLAVTLLLVAYAIFCFTEGAATLAWFDLIGKVLSPRLRGRFFGMIQLLGGIGSIAAGVFVQRTLTVGSSHELGFAAIFGLGCAAFFVSCVCIARVSEKNEGPSPKRESHALQHLTRPRPNANWTTNPAQRCSRRQLDVRLVDAVDGPDARPVAVPEA